MTLGESQRHFAHMVGRLLIWCHDKGYGVTFGEAYRTPEQAALNAQTGAGISNSLHTKRLAIDLNLFVDGVYRADSAAHLPLGIFWESIGGSWGGRFRDSQGNPKPDGGHYSLSYGGVK